jgi:hypothetical protein
MLFPFEEQSHKILMILILALASIIAIYINQADFSGKKKLGFFIAINRFCKFFLIPAASYMLVVQLIGVATRNYINVDNSAWRLSIAFGSIMVLILCFARVLPLTKNGIFEVKRNSITSSKYQRIFKSLRSTFMAIMVFVIFTFWLTYMFS